ncbi:hypothetical protein V8F33_007812 [Rhypophila sp. PSN 637]
MAGTVPRAALDVFHGPAGECIIQLEAFGALQCNTIQLPFDNPHRPVVNVEEQYIHITPTVPHPPAPTPHKVAPPAWEYVPNPPVALVSSEPCDDGPDQPKPAAWGPEGPGFRGGDGNDYDRGNGNGNSNGNGNGRGNGGNGGGQGNGGGNGGGRGNGRQNGGQNNGGGGPNNGGLNGNGGPDNGDSPPLVSASVDLDSLGIDVDVYLNILKDSGLGEVVNGVLNLLGLGSPSHTITRSGYQVECGLSLAEVTVGDGVTATPVDAASVEDCLAQCVENSVVATVNDLLGLNVCLGVVRPGCGC